MGDEQAVARARPGIVVKSNAALKHSIQGEE
jgi:hypothetical protein